MIEEKLLEEPHIKGHRISVRQIHALHEERDLEPQMIADRFNLDITAVNDALAYYRNHEKLMQEIEEERRNEFEEFKQSINRPDGVDLED